MDDLNDLLRALPAEDVYEPQIPAARKDARVKLLSLPAELLHCILDFCNYSSVLSLMSVNHTFHAVALWKFYANVYVRGTEITTPLKTLDVKLPIEEIIPKLGDKRFGVVGGLLRRPEHLATLSNLHIINFPDLPTGKASIAFDKILRYILENSVSIQELHLPFTSLHRHASIYQGLGVSSSLNTLSTMILRGGLVPPIIQSAQLRTLHITHQCATFEDLDAIGESMLSTLRDLECSIHIVEREWEESLGKHDLFGQRFTNLETLKFAYCSCYGVATPSHEILIECYIRLVASMSNLTFLTVDDRRYRRFGNTQFGDKSEYQFVTALAESNPVLRKIGIQYLVGSEEDGRGGRTVVWTAANSDVAEGSRDTRGLPCVWTPSPHLRSRWPFWYETFGGPKRILYEMNQRWKSPVPGSSGSSGSGSIPTLPTLEQLQKFLRQEEPLLEELVIDV